MKILYVEDEIAHVILTERVLEENLDHGFKLIHAETISAALRLLDTDPCSDADDNVLSISKFRLDKTTRPDREESLCVDRFSSCSFKCRDCCKGLGECARYEVKSGLEDSC